MIRRLWQTFSLGALPKTHLRVVFRPGVLRPVRLKELRRALRCLTAVTASSALLSEISGLEAAVGRMADGIREATGVDAVEVAVLDPKTRAVAVRGSQGSSDQRAAVEPTQSMAASLCERVLTSGRPLIVNDLPGASSADRMTCRQAGVRSFACVPLQVEGRVLGVMTLYSRSGCISLQDAVVLEALGHLLGVALENVRLYEQARAMATTDHLTGLYSRGHLMERLEEECRRAARYGRPFSLVLVDLDGLKPVNDQYGHLAGDRLLREVAQRLRASVRGMDVLGRYGGDEFVLLLPETGAAEALQAAERMRRALSDHEISVGDDLPGLRVTAGFGVAAYPGDGQTAEALIGSADAALYRAKASVTRTPARWRRSPWLAGSPASWRHCSRVACRPLRPWRWQGRARGPGPGGLTGWSRR
jgi:diguanylate cyclase (GGDEF)-like protein